MNGTIIYGEDCPREELFGPGLSVHQPEALVDPETGKERHATYLQKREKYRNQPQSTMLKPPMQGIEKDLTCFSKIGCRRRFRFYSQVHRHCRLNHGRDKVRQPTAIGRVRKRPSKRVRHLRVVRPRQAVIADAGDAGADATAVGVGASVDASEVGANASVVGGAAANGGIASGDDNSSKSSDDDSSSDDASPIDEIPTGDDLQSGGAEDTNVER